MPVTATLNARHFFTLMPEIALAIWGLILLFADLGPFRHRSADQRRHAVSLLARVGSFVVLGIAILSICVRFNLYELQAYLNLAGIDYLVEPDPMLFHGAISCDMLTELMNILLATLFVFVVWMSDLWPFTDNWGEYYALMFWSTVGMMLLIASEELLTLFLTLEMMTICLYLATAFEKDKRRSAEGGLKYFVYGSVSSALFLFGLSMIYGLSGSTQFYAIRSALTPLRAPFQGMEGNVAGVTAVLLIMVGFGFKVAAVPFHQWAPDAYEGAPAPVTAWVATGSKVASFIALMKVLLHALGPWTSGGESVVSPGWIGIVVVLSAASMTFGNFAALAQKNFKRMLAYSSIAHAGYMLVGVAAAGVSFPHDEAAGSVLFYLVIYGFSNIGAFAVAAWLAKDKGSDAIDDLNGLGKRYPGLGVCIMLLMLSLIGMPPLAGFFGKLYMFMEALDEPYFGRITLMWLVALGLMNSVVSAFYYVRVLKAMFLRDSSGPELKPAPNSVAMAIILATVVAVGFGLYPAPLVNLMKGAAVPMLATSSAVGPSGASTAPSAPGAGEKTSKTADVITPAQAVGMTPPAPPAMPAPKNDVAKEQSTTKTKDQPKTDAPAAKK